MTNDQKIEDAIKKVLKGYNLKLVAKEANMTYHSLRHNMLKYGITSMYLTMAEAREIMAKRKQNDFKL